jgi:hypothetical protein
MGVFMERVSSCGAVLWLRFTPLTPALSPQGGRGGKGADIRAFQNLRSAQEGADLHAFQNLSSTQEGADIRAFQNLSSAQEGADLHAFQT